MKARGSDQGSSCGPANQGSGREANEWLRNEVQAGIASGVSGRSLADIHRDVRSKRTAALND